MIDRLRLPVLTALLTIAAFGQDSPHTGTQRAGAVGWSVSVGAGPLAGPAVTGAPYSAEEIAETVQTLADGTHITRPSGTVKTYRDSEGRIRTERSFPVPGAPGQSVHAKFPAMIVITDPVAHVMYTLSAYDKVAHKVSMQATESGPAAPREAPAVTRTDASFRAAHEATDADHPKTTQEQLGNQTIEGVPVEGTRRTTIWPVASRGNDRPITVVSETWRSPDLGVVVLSEENDPTTGESTRKLTNISRAEPDPSLFQPPADYMVVTQETEGSVHH